MIKSVENSEHYIWGDNCDGWRLVQTESLSIIQERMPAHTEEQLHYHSRAQQFFYVLKGVATFDLDGDVLNVTENKGIHIKPNQRHKIMNKTDQDLEFIVISEPQSRGDRTEL